MEQHTGLLQSPWHGVGLTLGCPHLASLMGTPSGQYVHLPYCPSSCTCVFFFLHFCSFFIHFLKKQQQIFTLFPHVLHACIRLLCGAARFQLDRSLCPLFSPLSLSLSLSLEGCNATGASEAQERSLGKKEQRAVRLQPSPPCTSSPSRPPCSFLPWFPSLPSPHWPAPQIKTSDKKMGSLKKGAKKRGEEREKEVRNKPRGAE